MYVRLGRYGLYGILGLRDVGAIDINVRGGDVISRIALAIRGRSGVGLLRLLQAARIKKIAVILAGSWQFLLHVIQIGQPIPPAAMCTVRNTSAARSPPYACLPLLRTPNRFLYKAHSLPET